VSDVGCDSGPEGWILGYLESSEGSLLTSRLSVMLVAGNGGWWMTTYELSQGTKSKFRT
jgi:hypothetical protein